MFMDYYPLSKIDQVFVSAGEIVAYPLTLIHRVLSSEPNTLTLNVVFKEETDQPFYDVFISKEGSIEDVKVSRDIMLADEASSFVARIISLLEDTKLEDVAESLGHAN